MHKKKSTPNALYPLLQRYNKYSQVLATSRADAHPADDSCSSSRPSMRTLDLDLRKRFKRTNKSRYRSFVHNNRTLTPSKQPELASLLPPAKKSSPLTERSRSLYRSRSTARRGLNLSTGRKTLTVVDTSPYANLGPVADRTGTLRIGEMLELCRAEVDV